MILDSTKHSFFMVSLVLVISCKATGKAQEERQDSITNKEVRIEKPKFSEKDIYHPIAPGSIALIGQIERMERKVTLCDKEYDEVLVLKVISIKGSGSSIINPIHVNQSFRAIFYREIVVKESPDLILNQGGSYELVVTEQLCKETNQTIYAITQLKRL